MPMPDHIESLEEQGRANQSAWKLPRGPISFHLILIDNFILTLSIGTNQLHLSTSQTGDFSRIDTGEYHAYQACLPRARSAEGLLRKAARLTGASGREMSGHRLSNTQTKG